MRRSKHPKKASPEAIEASKNEHYGQRYDGKKQCKCQAFISDEAGFKRINKPKYCWCFPGVRLDVPCHHIREYRYAYGAVDPIAGEALGDVF